MQISLKLLRGINHAKSTVYIKFQLLVTFSSLFTASSSLSVFARSVRSVRSVCEFAIMLSAYIQSLIEIEECLVRFLAYFRIITVLQ